MSILVLYIWFCTWSSLCNSFQKMSNKLQVLVWSSRCKFFWNALDPAFQKNKDTSMVQKWCSDPILVIYLKSFLFHFQINNKYWNFFLTFFEKKYNNWITWKLPNVPNGQGSCFWIFWVSFLLWELEV